MIDLDAIDLRILDVLRHEGRIPMLDLAARVGLSATPCGRRVRRLESAGVIKGYAAVIDPAATGQSIGVLIAVRLARHGPEGTQQFLSAVARRREITECLLVTGNIDYMLRVQLRDIDALALFIREVLQAIPSVVETSTMVILSEDMPPQRRAAAVLS